MAEALSKRGQGPDRDAGGRFLPGHGVKSPGSPAVRRTSQVMQAVREACSLEKIKAALDKLYQLGMDGDNVPALVRWLAYSVGQPAPVQVTGERDLESTAQEMCEFLREARDRTSGKDVGREEEGKNG